MEDEINKHTASKNWKLVENKDVPQNTKIIQSIWTFKKGSLMEEFKNIVQDFVLMEVNNNGESITGKLMPQSSTG